MLGRSTSDPMPRLKQALFLFLALVGVGLGASFLVYQHAQTVLLESNQRTLTSTANFAASKIDYRLHQGPITPELASSIGYRLQVDALREIKRKSPRVKAIYTIVKRGDGMVYVADSSSAFDADRNGVEDAAVPGESADLDSQALWTFRQGLPSADRAPTTDKWGKWMSGYAPLVDEAGVVWGVVGVDQDSAWFADEVSKLAEVYSWGVVFIVMAGLLVAGVFYADSRTSHFWQSAPGRLQWIQFAVEFLLAVLAVASLIGGISSHVALIGVRDARTEEQNLLDLLTRTEGALLHMSTGRPVADISIHSKAIASSSATWLATDLVETAQLLKRDPQVGRAALLQLSTQVSHEVRDTIHRIDSLEREDDSLYRNQTISFLAGVLVMAAVFMLLRSRSNRDRQMLESVKEGQKAKEDLRQLVEQVPVGLFTWSDGEIVFSNPAWRQMMGLSLVDKGADFLQRIHPMDRESVVEVLAEDPERFAPTEIPFRVTSITGRISHAAMKAVPMPANEMMKAHILAFTIDVTESVIAKQTLQSKSQEVELKNRMLAAALEDLETNLESVVRCLVRAVEVKDPYTAGHSERVMEYSLWIGQQLGLGPYEMRVLELGTLVHDVGKIGIPDEILTKKGSLTSEEYAVIKQHPEMGVRILEGIGLFQDCMPVVRWHHERLNGTGYPDRLKGDEIPFLVRIAAVADVFDAMTSTRAYRSGIEPQIVIKVMRDDAERGLLDPIVVSALERAISDRGVIPQVLMPTELPKSA